MPWEYSQATGTLAWNARVIATGGYAGRNAGRNNPAMEQIRNIGPIPRGRYRIGLPRNTREQGPHILDLEPVGHNALGRTEFMMHGDSRDRPGQASHGCIVFPLHVRQRVAASGDNALIVTE